MQSGDELAKLVRAAIAAGGGKQTGGLVAPRTVERILGQRHELDVREAGLPDIGDQPVCHLQIRERPVALFRDAPPGTEVHFVDRDRRSGRVAGRAMLDPSVIDRHFGRKRRRDRGGSWPVFGPEGIGVGLQGQMAVRGPHLVLVDLVRRDAWNEQLPDPGFVQLSHHVRAPIPAIERTDHGDALCMRCPDGKAIPGRDGWRGRVGAEQLP
jgi:hypothetical protein